MSSNTPGILKPDLNNPDVDIVAFATHPDHFIETIGTEMHVKEITTGNTLLVIDKPVYFAKNKVLEMIRLEDGTPFLTEKDTTPDLPIINNVVFNPLIIYEVCQRISSGGPDSALSKICKLPGMPSYALLCKWRRIHPWIDEMLKEARLDRAEVLRDEALEHAMQARDKNDAPAASLKYEAKKWAAGIDDARYSPKAKVDVAVSVPTQINVVTGIDRDAHIELPKRETKDE